MALTDEPLSMDSAAIGGAADIGRLAAGQDSRTRWRDGLAARGAGTGAEWSRRIGVLMSTAMDDPEGRARIAAFPGGLQQLGWTDGRSRSSFYQW
jgi:hypothetical protein